MSAKRISEIAANYMEVAKEMGRPPSQRQYFHHPLCKFSPEQAIGQAGFGSWLALVRACPAKIEEKPSEGREPRQLIVDIECAPLKAYLWAMYDQSVSPNQVISHKYLLSFSARWVGTKKIIYLDQRGKKDVEDDYELTEALRNLLDEADVVIGQNSVRFDTRTINARIQKHRIAPPSPYQQGDTKIIAKRHFDLPSYSLEYMADYFGLCLKKLKSRKFIGFDLWLGCMAGKLDAFEEMKRYNMRDVEVTEELYNLIAPWGTGLKLAAIRGSMHLACKHCGGTDLQWRGYAYNASGKFRRFSCKACNTWGSETGASNNLLSASQKTAIKGER